MLIFTFLIFTDLIFIDLILTDLILTNESHVPPASITQLRVWKTDIELHQDLSCDLI